MPFFTKFPNIFHTPTEPTTPEPQLRQFSDKEWDDFDRTNVHKQTDDTGKEFLLDRVGLRYRLFNKDDKTSDKISRIVSTFVSDYDVMAVPSGRRDDVYLINDIDKDMTPVSHGSNQSSTNPTKKYKETIQQLWESHEIPRPPYITFKLRSQPDQIKKCKFLNLRMYERGKLEKIPNTSELQTNTNTRSGHTNDPIVYILFIETQTSDIILDEMQLIGLYGKPIQSGNGNTYLPDSNIFFSLSDSFFLNTTNSTVFRAYNTHINPLLNLPETERLEIYNQVQSAEAFPILNSGDDHLPSPTASAVKSEIPIAYVASDTQQTSTVGSSNNNIPVAKLVPGGKRIKIHKNRKSLKYLIKSQKKSKRRKSRRNKKST
jgi:hypothetical protein